VKYIWADAICINQSDPKEVGHQVRQMGSIYSTAERVIVWLGLGNPFEFFDESEGISTLIQRFCEHYTKEAHPITSTTQHTFEVYCFFSALKDLLRRPWFDRLWVVQEAGLAMSVLVLFGDQDQEIDLDDMIRFVSNTRADFAGYYSISGYETFTLFPKRSTIAHPSSLDKLDFLDLLYHTSTQLDSDPRDFVFALLGHPSAQAGDGLIIEPNYQRSHWEIYHELAITLLQQSQNLRVLSAVGHVDEKSLTRDYSSWIPTWERESNICHLGVSGFRCNFVDAHAGFPRGLQFIKASKMLQVQGFTFDTIEEYTNEFRYTRGSKVAGKSLIDEWPIGTAMALNAFSTMSTQEKLEELVTALVCGWPNYDRSQASKGQSAHFHNSCLEQSLKDFAAFRLHMWTRTSHPKHAGPCEILPEGLSAAEEAAKEGVATSFLGDSETMVGGKRLSTTRGGLIGTGPAVLRTGDICCILFGGRIPFLLRPVGSSYRLVGEAYIRKVMQGEAVVDFVLGDTYRSQTFDIF
jgi:hypothetical protein